MIENYKIDLSKCITQNIEPVNNNTISIKRLDLIHHEINGNKWFKLKYNIEKAKQLNLPLLTFGGAWSNHIYATAAAGKLFDIPTIGIIRGEELGKSNGAMLSSTLHFADSCGMRLEFISRMEYAEKDTEEFISDLHDRFGNFHLVPEGGSNFLGINGCMEILDDKDKNDFDYLCASVGTGATVAGILLSKLPSQKVLGFSALKNGAFLKDEVIKHLHYFLMDRDLAEEYARDFEIITEYHFGGYGKFTPELVHFIAQFESTYSIPLDQVYTGKMIYGLMHLARDGYFPTESKILALHTGGLQGKKSINAI